MRETNDDAVQLICVALLNLTVAPKIVSKDLEPFHNLGIDDKLLGACSIRDQQTSMPVSETKDHRALPSHTESPHVTVPAVTLARKVSPGLQDLQTRARRILAERNAEKAEENTWIGRMVAAKSIGELDGLIKSHAA